MPGAPLPRRVLAALSVLAAVGLPAASAFAVDFVPGPPLTGSTDRVIADPAVTESSGLAASARFPGVLYTHNDSGGGPVLYAVAADGSTAARLRLPGAPARDWEAIASGRDGDGSPVLWVGDIGDNNGVWPSVRVLKVAEPDRLADADLPWQRYDLVYPDGPHNAEALLVDPATQRLYVVTKVASDPGIYAAPATLSSTRSNLLTRVADAPPGVTDGAYAADGRLVLVDYVYAWFSAALRGPFSRHALPFRSQGESVAWRDDRTILVGSEGGNSEIQGVEVPGTAASVAPAPTTASSAAPQQLPGDTGPAGMPPWLPWAAGAGAAVLVLIGVALRR